MNAQTPLISFCAVTSPVRPRRAAHGLITVLIAALVAGHTALPAIAVAAESADPAADSSAPVTPEQASVGRVPDSWPHTTDGPEATFTVYQPQALSWQDHTLLRARTAIVVTPKKASAAGETKPLMGTLDLTFRTRTDLTTRTVVLDEARVDAVRFGSVPSTRAAQIESRIRKHIAGMGERDYPLDSILLGLDPQAVAGASDRQVTLNNEPPVILVSESPISLVVFDGKPVLVPIGKSTLSYVVNTNWPVFFDSGTEAWYLLIDKTWVQATTASGPWAAASILPASFSALPEGDGFARVRAALPLQPATEVPAVRTAETPTEIILTDGPPIYEAIAETALEYVANSDAALIRDKTDNAYYYLVSGRWFRAETLAGPWTFATTRLPADFLAIPADGPRGFVRVSIPGTPEAEQALIQARIPEQRKIERANATLTVVYAGDPRFEQLGDTRLEYAVNTSFDVLRYKRRYYACHEARWYTARRPEGPWTLADEVPEVIYSIPPSHPLHRVTYVRIYDATPTTVTYGYTSGYSMGYVSSGVVVYGTGWYYPPVVIPGAVPVYYPYPYSYAGAVYYNPANGAWAQGGAIYGPYGGVAAGGTAYNPATGAWAQRGAVYGPNGGASAVSAYNPSTGGYVQGSAVWDSNSGAASADWYNANSGIAGSTDQSWESGTRTGSSTFSGSEQTVNTRSQASAEGAAGGFSSSSGAKGVGATDGQGNSAGVVQTEDGDLYAGSDGNVYRKTDEGWQTYEDGTWSSADPASSERAQSAQANAESTRQSASSQSTSLESSSAPATSAQSTSAPSTSTQSSSAQSSSAQATSAQSSGERSTSAERSGAGERSTTAGTGERSASASDRSASRSSDFSQLDRDRAARTEGSAQRDRASSRSFGGFQGGGRRGGGGGRRQ